MGFLRAFYGAGWGETNMIPATSAAAIAPDGQSTAVVFNTAPTGSSASPSAIAAPYISAAAVTGDPNLLYHFSVFYSGSSGWISYRNRNGVASGYVAAPNTNVWGYVETRGTNPANGGITNLYLGRPANGTVSDLKAWGGQIEFAPFPSSFIYTDATVGGSTNTRTADNLTFTTTPEDIYGRVWEVDIYPLHGSTQDGYNATTLPLGLQNKDFGLFAFSGDTAAKDGNFISLRYGSSGATSLHIQQSAGDDIDIGFNWVRDQPITLTVTSATDPYEELPVGGAVW